MKRIEAQTQHHKIRRKVHQRAESDCQFLQILLRAGPGWERKVDVRAARIGGSGLAGGAGVVRVLVLAVDADVEDAWVGVEGLLGAVAVVEVEVEDSDVRWWWWW